jgi:hypothetical protein
MIEGNQLSKLKFLEEICISLSKSSSSESIANCFRTYENKPDVQVTGGVNHYQTQWLMHQNPEIGTTALNAFILGLMVADFAETEEGKKLFQDWVAMVQDIKSKNTENVIDIKQLRNRRKINETTSR